MRFIEYYGVATAPDALVEIDGRSVPTPSLVEDDDGIRLLIISGSAEIPVTVWSRAHADGAAAIVLVHDADESYWMLTETFIEHRGEHHQTASFRIPVEFWSPPESTLLSYREMTIAQNSRETPDGPPRFVHLHTHSEFSPLDGLSKMSEIVAEVVKDGQTAVAVTDHGVCAGHPDLQAAARKAGIKPIFGIEANFVNDRFKRGTPKTKENEGKIPPEDESRFVLGDYTHLVMWAMNDDGLRNLWAMSTEANRDGFYGRARMDWDTISRLSEGVMASTACLRGPVVRPLLEGNEDLARANLARLMDIFPDRLYVELHTNHLPEQIKANHALVALAREFGLPLIVAVDAHYPCKEDATSHAVWIASQTDKDLTDDADLFAGQQDYHLMTEAEVREAISYLGAQVVDEAVHNTAIVAERCTAEIQGATTTPIFSKSGTLEERAQRDVDRLVDLCMKAWPKTLGRPHSQDEYMARFEREMALLVDKGFCGYFLMVADYCLAAKEGRVGGTPIMVGPGRGSGGGSLVAWLSGITDLDPVDTDLLFERFLTEGRVSLPDFDVDFPASKRGDLMTYVIGKYGEDYVMRVGTNTRLQNKGIFRALASVLKNTIDIHYPDIEAIVKIIDEAESDKAGLGISWEDLWDQFGDLLDPWRSKYPLMFQYAEALVGRLKSYGKHPAGVVIATDEPLTGRIPMRSGEDGVMVAEFDMNALESLGLVKFDFLTLRTLDTIQEAADIVRSQFGQSIDVYGWREEYNDPYVWEELGLGHTLGVFQIETASGTRMTKRFKPSNLHELADVITLVRPGPMRSGLTETYLRRRAGLEPVEYADPRLEAVLARTYGCLLYQEDIMAACMVLAGYDSNEADAVRKILGKKQVEKVAEAGKKFVKAAVERGMEQEGADVLWAQMAEFAKYSFNRAHAYGYAVLGYWTAWYKFNYAAQFLVAVLSTLADAGSDAKKRIPEFVNEARRIGYKVLPPDINVSGHGFSIDGINVRYGFDSVKGIGQDSVPSIVQGQPYTTFEDFMDRRGPKANAGIVKTLAAVGAFDSIHANRRALERRLVFDTTAKGKDCQHKDANTLGPGGLPCTFDWANEVDPPTERKRVDGQMILLPKPPPKRCTTACRNYTAPVFDPLALGNYTPAEIRDKEMELLGIFLSSTPFDVIPPEMLEDELANGEEIEAGPSGEYVAAVTVQRVRPHTTKTGKEMGFVTFLAHTSEVDTVVFSEPWVKFSPLLKPGSLHLAYLAKDERGLKLLDLQPL